MWEEIARWGVGGAGCVPLVLSAYWGYVALTLSLAFAVTVSVARGPTRLLTALDASAGVALTVVLSLYLRAYASTVGAVRVVWLVALVTSSCGYEFVRELVPEASMLPNDVTLVAVAVAGGLLVGTAVLARACEWGDVRDERATAVEMVLSGGALGLRFDLSGHEWSVWHVACWVAAGLTLNVLRRPR